LMKDPGHEGLRHLHAQVDVADPLHRVSETGVGPR
jgi:hypothetical protein